MADELSSKSSGKQDKSKIPIVTLPKDTCTEKTVVAETHSTRDKASKQNTDAQDRNCKSKRHCEARKKNIQAANRAKMEGEQSSITARLRNQELWEMFHREETEMIITKAGRYLCCSSIFMF